MYIDLATLATLFWGFIGILSVTALVFLIIALNKFTRLVNNANSLILTNKTSIDKLCSTLPQAADNIVALTDNLNDVSEVITSTTADVIVAKENITTNIETIKDIIDIIVRVFSKK